MDVFFRNMKFKNRCFVFKKGGKIVEFNFIKSVMQTIFFHWRNRKAYKSSSVKKFRIFVLLLNSVKHVHCVFLKYSHFHLDFLFRKSFFGGCRHYSKKFSTCIIWVWYGCGWCHYRKAYWLRVNSTKYHILLKRSTLSQMLLKKTHLNT